MSASAFQSSGDNALAAQALASVRVDGGFRIAVADVGGVTRVADIEERGGWRVRFPYVSDARSIEAISINTGGGIIGGDRIRSTIDVTSGHLVVATQSAERIYRSLGPVADIHSDLTVGEGASLEWLPQETILYSGAKLRRRYEIALAETARLLMIETIVLGRTASGESVRTGDLVDQWRVRRNGKLILAEALQLSGAIDDDMRRSAIGGGAKAMAVMVLVAPDAEDRVGLVRSTLDDTVGDCGVSAWNGMLVMRIAWRDAAAMRTQIVRVLKAVRGAAMPRVWSL